MRASSQVMVRPMSGVSMPSRVAAPSDSQTSNPSACNRCTAAATTLVRPHLVRSSNRTNLDLRPRERCLLAGTQRRLRRHRRALGNTMRPLRSRYDAAGGSAGRLLVALAARDPWIPEPRCADRGAVALGPKFEPYKSRSSAKERCLFAGTQRRLRRHRRALGYTMRPLRGRYDAAGGSAGRALARCTRRARPTAIISTAPRSRTRLPLGGPNSRHFHVDRKHRCSGALLLWPLERQDGPRSRTRLPLGEPNSRHFHVDRKHHCAGAASKWHLPVTDASGAS